MGMASSSAIFHKTESCEKKWEKLTSIFIKFGQEFLHFIKLLYRYKYYSDVMLLYIFVYVPAAPAQRQPFHPSELVKF